MHYHAPHVTCQSGMYLVQTTGIFGQLRRMGFSAATFQLEDSPDKNPTEQDINDGLGLALGLSMTLRLFKCAPCILRWKNECTHGFLIS